ncbi:MULTISPECIES: phage major capsid protein [Helcococcus]|uniref:Phage major capsid protein n=1 Tax=Helcococcus bovis TaxID=3153252 RepID=A0ABW9F603_9FIRM
MNKLQEMIEKRNSYWEQTKNFVEDKKDKDGLLSKEDYKEYEKMEDKIKNYSIEIERLRRESEINKELEKPVNEAIKNRPMAMNEKDTPLRKKEEYKNAMLNALRSNFKRVDNILQEGIDENGGYLVPEEYDDRIIQILEQENIMRKLATNITTQGERKINIAASMPAASWIEEGGEFKFGEGSFNQVILDAFKLHVGIKVTDELLYDSSFDLETFIINEFGKALSNAEEDAFLNGDGKNKPTGVFDSTNGGSLLPEVNLTTDSLIDLVYKLKRPYRKNASFIINDNLIGKIRKLKDANQAYIWQSSYQEGEPDRLLGYPVYTSQFAPEDKIAFGDFYYYNIGDRGTRGIQELRELFAGNGMVGFLAKERVDGKLVLKEAVQILPITKAL